ncbi:hypothetical protein [Alloactinosynnema sp. L-07]|uniref:DUF4328 domain-containing protein n=1 Tax=Alloactinosynnema sp. L-07 TaxID=1653480 RepID=UPI00065EF9BD|nr:DUF4328 domain-containing protein [Alloactinosynnema sp. L-07]CRK60137.1 hypothetical protein [Alloactinosynnema sp. L-07]
MTDPDDDTPAYGIARVLPDERPLIRPARAARFVASLLILITAAVAGLAFWQAWRSYFLVRDALSAIPTVTAEQLDTAERNAEYLSWGWLAGLTLSGIAFIAWLWRARVNSARMCDAPQRLRIRWAVFGWFVPVANLWWPQMVVGDVWRASRPDVPARGADLRDVPPSKTVSVWWGLFLAMNAVDLYAVNFLADESTEKAFEQVLIANAVSGGLAGLAAVFALAIMWRIDRWQTNQVAVR